MLCQLAIIILAIGIIFGLISSCREEEPLKGAEFEPVMLGKPITFRHGTYEDIYMGITFSVYVPDHVTLDNSPIVMAFPSTPGSHNPVRELFKAVADGIEGILMVPNIQYTYDPLLYAKFLDSLAMVPAINPDKLIMGGYSSGAGTALYMNTVRPELIRGNILLAPGRAVLANEPSSEVSVLAKTCICTGDQDLAYDANQKLHEKLNSSGVTSKILVIPSYNHADMLSRNYTTEKLQCANFVLK